MLKGLCITALAIAVIVFALFFADLGLGLLGMASMAPFKYNSLMMDLIFILCAAVLAAMSFITFKEQV